MAMYHPAGCARQQKIKEIYWAIKDRVSHCAPIPYAGTTYTWNTLPGNGTNHDPGPPQPGCWTAWNRYRKTIELLPPYYANPATSDPWTWASFCNAVLGTPTWRAGDVPRCGLQLEDFEDAKTLLENLTHVHVGSQLGSGPRWYRMWGSDWEVMWDQARAVNPDSAAQRAGHENRWANPTYQWTVNIYFWPFDWASYYVPSGTAYCKIVGEREIGGIGAAFALDIEGAAIAPSWGPNDFGTYGTVLGTIAAAGAGAFSEIVELGEYKTYMRVVIPDTLVADNPFNDMGWRHARGLGARLTVDIGPPTFT